MAIISGIFNSINGDRRYDAKWFARYFATFIGNGVFPNPSTGLQVTENTKMTTAVKAGDGWINGYFIVNDGDYVLQHDVADGVLKRIDRVVMRLDFFKRKIDIVVKKGAYASTPVAPTLQRDADAYELALADVMINNGATVISQANITDLRLNKSLCGIVHGIVDQVDTTTLFNQYQSWMTQQKSKYESETAIWTAQKQQDFDQWQSQEKAEFDAWFLTIQDILDGNVAANLQVQIDKLTGRVVAVEEKVTTHLAEMLSQELGKGASLVGVHDAGNLFTATTVEGALKESITKANAAFTSASNGKSTIGVAITGVDPTVVIPLDPTFPQLATAIGQISTGKKWASGRGRTVGPLQPMMNLKTSTNSARSFYHLSAIGLGFIPSTIIATSREYDVGNSTFRIVTTSYTNGHFVCSNVLYDRGGDVFVGGPNTNFYLNDGGFDIPVFADANMDWVAFE